MTHRRCDTCDGPIDEAEDIYCTESDQWMCMLCETRRMADAKREYDLDPDRHRYREDMIAAGRGHLLGDK